MSKEIELTQGRYALVDEEDYEYLNHFNWIYLKAPKDSYGYAIGTTPPYRNKKMHRVILGAKKGEVVDHKNHVGVDNRRCNIKIVTISENNANRRISNSCGLSNVHGIKDRLILILIKNRFS